VFWFIAPKVWASKEWRGKKLKAYVNELFTIFPFETDFFAKRGIDVHYVGNPLVETVLDAGKNFRTRERFISDNRLDNRPIAALLPGSRRQEVKYMLPVMKRFAADFSDFQFVVAGSEALEQSFYDEILTESDGKTLPLLFGQTCETVHHAHAALVTSGTATLETAMLDTPQAVLYKMMGGWLGYKVVSALFLKVKYVSLPNLILDNEAVKEFIMHEMKYERIKPVFEKLLYDDEYRQKMKNEYRRINNLLGEPGAASRAAKIMVSLLSK
ncbi:MAG: lipid-A-disaccharide synthase, partial [Prolixibacteraceae bacterium]|nr:lipid-A-disaccharide synthase [Prolixibacteraceae bacterium]